MSRLLNRNFYTTAGHKTFVVLLVLLFSAQVFGLHMHNHHSPTCTMKDYDGCFCSCMLHANDDNDCKDNDCCEHSHKHGGFTICAATPVLPTPTDNLFVPEQSRANKAGHAFTTTGIQYAIALSADCRRLSYSSSGAGRVCPVTGQQLPLLN